MTLITALASTQASAAPEDLKASEPDSSDSRSFENPFTEVYDAGPGLLRVGLHMGSMHHDGLGPRVWVIPWQYLQLSASYAYRTQHSFAGNVSIPMFPRASITPYATGGYALAIAPLPFGLRLYTHELVAGLGLETRIMSRYFLGAEATLNVIRSVSLKNKQETLEVTPGERYSIVSGFHLGVTLP